MPDIRKPYPKGDVRRLLCLALAIFRTARPTLTTLAAATGHHKQTIQDDVLKLREQLGMIIEKEKDGPVYALKDWGPILNADGIETFLTGPSQVDKPMTRMPSQGEIALLARLERSPIEVVYGRTGWRPSRGLPKPANRADFDTVVNMELARIDSARGLLVKS